jgi:hypothetical protein
MAKNKDKKTKAEDTDARDERRAEKKAKKAAEKEAKKADKVAAKAAIASVRVEPLEPSKKPSASFDPAVRVLTLSLPMPAAGPRGETGPQGAQGPQGPQGIQGPRGETGPGLDLRRGPKDHVERELYVDGEGRLCFRAGTHNFVVSVTPRD